VDGLSDFLKALASETRQKMLFHVFIDGKERTVGEVAQAMGLGQSTVSEHLALLKRGGLLDSRKEGKEVHYRPDRIRIMQTVQKLVDRLSNCCRTE
jgi:ArsR family transcriptional regulator